MTHLRRQVLSASQAGVPHPPLVPLRSLPLRLVSNTLSNPPRLPQPRKKSMNHHYCWQLAPVAVSVKRDQHLLCWLAVQASPLYHSASHLLHPHTIALNNNRIVEEAEGINARHHSALAVVLRLAHLALPSHPTYHQIPRVVSHRQFAILLPPNPSHPLNHVFMSTLHYLHWQPAAHKVQFARRTQLYLPLKDDLCCCLKAVTIT